MVASGLKARTPFKRNRSEPLTSQRAKPVMKSRSGSNILNDETPQREPEAVAETKPSTMVRAGSKVEAAGKDPAKLKQLSMNEIKPNMTAGGDSNEETLQKLPEKATAELVVDKTNEDAGPDLSTLFSDEQPVKNAFQWLVQNFWAKPATVFGDESRNDLEECNATSDEWCGSRASEDDSLSDFVFQKSFGEREDSESVGSVSTVGQMFNDLMSLSSLPKKDNDDGSLFRLDSFSAISSQVLKDMPSADDLLLGPSASESSKDRDSLLHVDKETEKKIQDINVDEIVVANVKSDQGAETTSSGALKEKTQSKESQKQDTESVESRRQNLLKDLRRTIAKYGRYDIRCANIAVALGDLYDEYQEYGQALQVYQEASMIYITKLGDHHDTTLGSKINIGNLLAKNGKYVEAIETYFHVMSMRKAFMGEKHPSVADMLTLIAKALRGKGRNVQAIKELKRALKMYRDALGDSHTRVAATVDEIASLYMITGDYGKAVAILEEVVKLRAATMGLNHEDVARSLKELAAAQESLGERAKAMKSLKKSYAIYVQLEGDKGNNATLALERIGMSYKAMGEKNKAATALVGVLRGRKHTLGEYHRRVADAYLQLGVLLREIGQHEKAEKCMKHALAIYVGENKDMRDIGGIADVTHEMALIDLEKGEVLEASKRFKQEVAIRKKMGTDKLPEVARTLNHLGLAEHKLMNHSQALNCFMEALSIYEKTEGLGQDFGEALFNTGLALNATHHGKRAKEAFLESLKIFKMQGLADDDTLVMKVEAELKLMENN